MAKNNDSHIFDDVFRTMEEHIPELMLPLINEVFKSNYSMDTKVVRLGDKRHLPINKSSPFCKHTQNLLACTNFTEC